MLPLAFYEAHKLNTTINPRNAPPAAGLTLDAAGYFSHNGSRLVPVGANYWPGSCGVEMWQAWPEAEMQHDLDVLAGLGLNCIRFFLRWQDFEPEPGHYSEEMFARLGRFLEWCRDRHIYAQPSLFVGWMSGGIFWPHWKANSNLFADERMRERSCLFARRAAQTIAPFHDSLLGVDQGNELCCLPDSHAAPPDAVARWCQEVNSAIRSVYPNALIVSGNEQNQIISDSGWRLGQQPGTDYLSMHGYPVPAWHSVAFDGMTDPLCQSLLPFYTKIARAFAPVMVQEFGTIATFGPEQQRSYLSAVLPACWEAGANGFLWWCLRDIRARTHPYLRCGFEGTLGLVDDDDRVKPGLEYFLEFARSIASQPPPCPGKGAVGIYLPKHCYLRDNPLNPGNDPASTSRRLVMANYALALLGVPTRVVRGDLPPDGSVHTILVPGALLGSDEAEALEPWVRAGGHLIWHGPDQVNWGRQYIQLLGAVPVDYRAARPIGVRAFGAEWRFSSYQRNARVQVAARSAQVLAADHGGVPVLLTNRVGDGIVAYALPVVEDAMAEVSDQPNQRDRWSAWYRGMLSLVGMWR